MGREALYYYIFSKDKFLILLTDLNSDFKKNLSSKLVFAFFPEIHKLKPSLQQNWGSVFNIGATHITRTSYRALI